MWDLAAKKCLRKTRLDTMARALAWSPDGTQIAVGEFLSPSIEAQVNKCHASL